MAGKYTENNTPELMYIEYIMYFTGTIHEKLLIYEKLFSGFGIFI